MATDETAIEQSVAAMWLRNPRTGAVNLVVHPETIRRCLSEGHVAVPDPRLPAVADAPIPAPEPTPTPDPEAEAALHTAHIAATVERNNTAREVFGVAPVTSPATTRRKGRNA